MEKDAIEISKKLSSIDLMYCLSKYHAEYTAKFFKKVQGKIKITCNGIDLKLIESVKKKVHQKKYKMMFTTRPERGLLEALFIYEKLNDKNLEFIACIYSFPGETAEQTIDKYASKIDELKQKGFNISYHQYNKKELYENIAESKVVIYPANTYEAFCISALEPRPQCH